MAGLPRLAGGEGPAEACRGDGGRPDPTAPGRRGSEAAPNGSSRSPPLRLGVGSASGWTSAGGWPCRMHSIPIRETSRPVAAAAWPGPLRRTERKQQSAPRRLRSELRAGLARWIGFYNAGRPHSALAGLTPDEAYWG